MKRYEVIVIVRDYDDYRHYKREFPVSLRLLLDEQRKGDLLDEVYNELNDTFNELVEQEGDE